MNAPIARAALRAPARRTMLLECERCGQPHIVEHAGRFRDSDYVELHHELMDVLESERAYRRRAMRAELEAQRARRELEYLHSLLEHLDPFLPADMQRGELRDARPGVYAAIAEHLRS